MVIGTCRVLILGLDGVFLMTSRPDTQPGLRWENGEIKCHPMRTVPPNNAKHNCHGRAFIQTITRAIIWNRSFFKHYSRVGTIISQYGKGSSNKSLSKAHYIKKTARKRRVVLIGFCLCKMNENSQFCCLAASLKVKVCMVTSKTALGSMMAG